MSVPDNGIGFPKILIFKSPHSLGLELVNILVKQLKGQLKIVKKTGDGI